MLEARGLDPKVVPPNSVIVATGEKRVRIVGHSGDVVDALLLTVEDVLGGRFWSVEICVDDYTIPGA